MRMFAWSFIAAAMFSIGCSGDGTNPLNSSPTLRQSDRTAAKPDAAGLAPMVTSSPVKADADDPAIWVNREDPSRSLVFATDKIEKTGALYAFDLAGKQVQVIEGLDRPNNVDVQHDFKLGDEKIDIAVVTERMKSRLRIFKISQPDGKLTEISGRTDVFVGKEGEEKAAMGVGLYGRKDGTVFAIVSPKEGPQVNRLAQYQLLANANGKVDLTLSRYFGNAAGKVGEALSEVEAIVVDDELGFVYYADELVGIRKYHADPDHKDAKKELALFATSGYAGDREGLAIFATGEGTGFLASSDQIAGGSKVHLYPREGSASNPHEHAAIASIATTSDDTDGLDVTAMPLGTQFPNGLLVMMNSKDKNFSFYDWGQIAQRGNLRAAR